MAFRHLRLCPDHGTVHAPELSPAYDDRASQNLPTKENLPQPMPGGRSHRGGSGNDLHGQGTALVEKGITR
jgi:hypothetical protein